MNINENSWREYRSRLFSFIRKRVNDYETAEDILQEVLITSWLKLDNLRDDGRLISWMYTIARRGVIDYYRKKEKEPTLNLESSLEDNAYVEPFPPNSSPPVEQELANCILPMIDQLPPTYRRALLYTELHGMSQKDLAIKEGLSISGAKSRVQRGRAMLKEMMTACCRLEFDRQGRIIDAHTEDCHSCHPDKPSPECNSSP